MPREFETVRFPFVHGKIGTDYLEVKKIEHQTEDHRTAITLWLEDGFLNRYREFAIEKALFQGLIGDTDVFHKHSFELDDQLRKIYRK